ncbi:MAG TPA: hypothetical protein VH092_06445 [Urbifossiella sp.]|jgi:hypothetical protein|nr:hypothetical protein [Urbifossiella sp.]
MTAILLGLAIGGPPAAPPPAEYRVGSIMIVGNSRTADRDILRELNVLPGQRLPDATDLRKAEIRMLLKFHRRFDIDGGKWPVVEVIANESAFRDVRISFPER